MNLHGTIMKPLLNLAFLCAALAASSLAGAADYRNPLPVRLADGTLAENCADPAILRDHDAAVQAWYLYCTSDPLSYKERDGKDWHSWIHRLCAKARLGLVAMGGAGQRARFSRIAVSRLARAGNTRY
jgi:hypothetical protein